ncbi:hypothetical protein ABFS82_06G031800 [Erythranthe guttata]|uniref:Sec-independent protein translocase protein TATB, chloroplastic n=1 Tax=Erythranthe guttata TaxID=4155 RepID=A0A022QAY7_ERYGU|nr:PREDICTED: sec-independent protein translocase protein TATB, chloroplastic-like [Erythranthe guttata]EYU25116.1 hypothetical protein MIMGU_mgv1a010951mg [Erythranthe guttata]|eukprot:XP_012852115.1 PREDICTED: sec-independent protein translocase protein TATB, chloroplastic-like [Erythranthe guttata]
MAFAISTPTSSLLNSSSSSAGVKTSSFCSLSNSAIQIPRITIFHHSKCISQLGCASFSQWSGLKLVGISTSQYLVKLEKKGKCKGKGVYASLFGVGAPEVLVIGVVALLVFGPKGLAEVARNLGQTLRAFQPTIRELQEVSREFKSTLEREIGLDDIDKPLPKSSGPNTTKPTSEAALENLGTNIEPNGSSSENVEDPSDKYLNVKADRFRGALAQLQKEQEEEEREKAQLLEETELKSESQTPSSQDTPQATEVDTQEASSVTKSPSENLDKNDALQEAASVASVGPPPTTETQI